MLDYSVDYEVITYSTGDTKAGTKMGKLQLKNTVNDLILNCILWEETLNRIDSRCFRTGNLIKILNGSYNEKYNNCIVSNIEVIVEASLGLDEETQEKHFKTIKNVVLGFKNEKLKIYILDLLEEHKSLLKVAPAAKLHHHNYIGGLIQHIIECLEFAEPILKLMVHKVAKDDVLGACILHDFGKIFEYTIDLETGLIDYNESFKKTWFTHSQWGYSNCITNGFENIAKMIASHHSRLEWGAIVDLNEKNLEPLMYLIHHIDDLSAKFGKTSINDL